MTESSSANFAHHDIPGLNPKANMKAATYCDICRELSLSEVIRAFANREPTRMEFSQSTYEKEQQNFPHHRTYSSLVEAAEQGGTICTAFRRALLDRYKLSYSWPEEKTIRFHQCIENHFEAPFSVSASVADFAYLAYRRPHMVPAQEDVIDEAKAILAEYLESEGSIEPRVHLASDREVHPDIM